MCQLLAPNTRKLEGSLAGPAPAPEGIFNESRLINLWLVILYIYTYSPFAKQDSETVMNNHYFLIALNSFASLHRRKLIAAKSQSKQD